MLDPGITFTGTGQVNATIGAGTVPDFVTDEGIGFMNNGNVAMDTNAPPANPTYHSAGFVFSANQALCVVIGTQSLTDTWVDAIRITAQGQIIIESAPPVLFANGDPVTANGNYAVN